MQFIKDNKVMILAIAGGLLAVWVYFNYFSGESLPLLTSTTEDESVVVTQELLAILGGLRNIKLDESIFKDPVFISLSDFGVRLDLQPVGRRNPFEPLFGPSGTGGVEVPGAPR